MRILTLPKTFLIILVFWPRQKINKLVKKETCQLKSCNKYETLNQVEISIKSNTVVADSNRYKNCKYCFLMNSLLFSASITNNTNITFISCNGLNDANESLINGKLYKTIGFINSDQIHN